MPKATSNGLARLRASHGGCDSPVAVPEKFIGLTLVLEFFDRCHSLSSLFLPLAALASLPTGQLHLVFRVRPSDNKKRSHPEWDDFFFGDLERTRTVDLQRDRLAC